MTARPRGKKWREIRSFLRITLGTRTRDEWFAMLSQADVPVGKVLDFNELFSDPQVQQRGMVVSIDDPILGQVRQVGTPFKLSETPGSVRRLSPILGQDTDEILRSVGYARSQVEAWRDLGVVG